LQAIIRIEDVIRGDGWIAGALEILLLLLSTARAPRSNTYISQGD
jgi:hypothetical protein